AVRLALSRVAMPEVGVEGSGERRADGGEAVPPDAPTPDAGAVAAADVSPADLALAPHFEAALEALVDALRGAEHELAELDAVAGDGDHGRGMLRGATAALEAARTALADGSGARGVLGAAGSAWADRAGGTSGVLWGAMLRAIAADLDPPVDLAGLARAV